MITFNESTYIFNHGAKPRGRGSYAFALSAAPKSEDIIWTPVGTYAESKRAAAAVLKARGLKHETLYVLP